jgi:hypothetical protein
MITNQPSAIMKLSIAVIFALSLFAGAAFAAPKVPLFTRADALARLSAVASVRTASGAECVACEEALGEVIHQAIGVCP